MNPVEQTPSRLSIALNLFGVAVVAYYVVHDYGQSLAAWMLVAALLGLVAWLVEILAPVAAGVARWKTSALRIGVLAVMAATGSLIAPPTLGLGIVLVALALVRLVGTLEFGVGIGLGVAAASAAVVTLEVAFSLALPAIALVIVPALNAGGAVGTVGGTANSPVGGTAGSIALVATLLGTLAGIIIATLVGVSRRQSRAAEAQARALLDERQAVREEQHRVHRLGERQALSRDIHDVLAHSLGGLVLQLDAVDALLEAGRFDEAANRVRSARQLAASGLGEARRAVDALRDPESAAPVALPDLIASIAQLADAHRALGGTVTLTATPHEVDAPPPLLSGDAAEAFRRAVQEGLTNARKHSPGSPVDITVAVVRASAADGGRIELTIRNPLAGSGGAELARSGGGNGVVGLRERFVALDGGSATAEAEGGEFVVRAAAAVAPPRPDATAEGGSGEGER